MGQLTFPFSLLVCFALGCFNRDGHSDDDVHTT